MSYERAVVELEEHLAEALGKSGVAGSVSVVGVSATLTGNGPTVTVDVTHLLTQWPLLGGEQRKRRAAELARRMASDRRTLSGTARSGAPFALPSFLPPTVALVGVVAFVAGAWFFYRKWLLERELAAHPPVIRDYDAYERDRAARAARVCSATRTRVMRGAVVGPSDVEGWVVELVVLRGADTAPPANDPALAAFIERALGQPKGHVRAPSFPALSGLDGPDTNVTVSEADLVDGGAPVMRGVRFVFAGRYVTPYFDDTARAELVSLARGMNDALGGTHAGLYARCASADSHHLGSWFRGPGAGGALSSLLFFMGTSGDLPDVRAALLVPPGATAVDPAFAFKNVSAATRSVKKARAVALLGPELGAISGADDQTCTLTFPFRDSNRASRAARGIARELGIGDAR